MKLKVRSQSHKLIRPIALLIAGMSLVDVSEREIAAPQTRAQVHANQANPARAATDLDEVAPTDEEIDRRIRRTTQIESRAEYKNAVNKLHEFERRINAGENRRTVRRQYLAFRHSLNEENPEIYRILRIRIEAVFRNIDNQ
jgi:hypothetical protein